MADAAAGNGFTANPHLGVNLDMKAEFGSELRKLLHCPLCLVAKMEICPFVHLSCPELINNHLLNEFSRRFPRKLGSEGNHKSCIEAGLLQ